jgi:hypothetical protein
VVGEREQLHPGARGSLHDLAGRELAV